jgi:hypothetical protein
MRIPTWPATKRSASSSKIGRPLLHREQRRHRPTDEVVPTTTGQRTASTRPAMSEPSVRRAGARSPPIRAYSGAPRRHSQSDKFTDVEANLTTALKPDSRRSGGQRHRASARRFSSPVRGHAAVVPDVPCCLVLVVTASLRRSGFTSLATTHAMIALDAISESVAPAVAGAEVNDSWRPRWS